MLIDSLRHRTTEELAALIGTLAEEHDDDIETVAKEMKPCEYSETQHYEEFGNCSM